MELVVKRDACFTVVTRGAYKYNERAITEGIINSLDYWPRGPAREGKRNFRAPIRRRVGTALPNIYTEPYEAGSEQHIGAQM